MLLINFKQKAFKYLMLLINSKQTKFFKYPMLLINLKQKRKLSIDTESTLSRLLCYLITDLYTLCIKYYLIKISHTVNILSKTNLLLFILCFRIYNNLTMFF